MIVSRALDPESCKVIEWRVDCMMRVGIGEVQAVAVAILDRDWRQAVEMVKDGASPQSAVEVVL